MVILFGDPLLQEPLFGPYRTIFRDRNHADGIIRFNGQL
jgi:hypothetical protein